MGNKIETIADIYYNRGNYQDALLIYQRELEKHIKDDYYGDYEKICELILKIGEVKCELGEYE
jgi:TolA-binding protein